MGKRRRQIKLFILSLVCIIGFILLRHLIQSQSEFLKAIYYKGIVFMQRNESFLPVSFEIKHRPMSIPELYNVEKLVYQNLVRLQNPKNCSQAKYLVCTSGGSGLGSIMHIINTCFLFALGTNRTMLVDYSVIEYKGLKKIFQPLSSTCIHRYTPEAVFWEGEYFSPRQDNISMVKYSQFSKHQYPNTAYTLGNMPRAVAEELSKFHLIDANAWWAGQLLKYQLRVEPWVEELLKNAKKRLHFIHPVVGIHIRRTDKIQEAKYQSVEKYMQHVITWYNDYNIKNNFTGSKRVYVATDEFQVLSELKSKYPNFLFLHPVAIRTNTKMNNRYSDDGVIAYLTDIMLLKDSDFFVGTFSSNCGRLVNELRAAEGRKRKDSVSLDLQFSLWHEAIADYFQPQKDELEFQIGDKIQFDIEKTNKTVGYGINERTKQQGYYSTSKVKAHIRVIEYEGFK